MSLASNIWWGEAAVKFVKSKVANGASSNNIKAHVMESKGGIEGMIKDKTFKVDMNVYTKPGDIHKNNPLTFTRAKAVSEANWHTANQAWTFAVRGDTPAKTEYRIKAAMAEKHKIGNCGEQAMIAYFYLEGNGVVPIDLVQFSSPGYDHVWVLIGRPASKSLANIAEWGDTDTVWCDPWQGRYGMVYSINDLVKRKVVNLDAKFKLDSIENVQAGLPKSILRG